MAAFAAGAGQVFHRLQSTTSCDLEPENTINFLNRKDHICKLSGSVTSRQVVWKMKEEEVCFSRHAGQTAQANGQHRAGLWGPWGPRGNRNSLPSLKQFHLHVSTKGWGGDLLGSVGSFHIRLHKKLICKWKEGLSKVHQLRDHIGLTEYKTRVLNISQVFRGA